MPSIDKQNNSELRPPSQTAQVAAMCRAVHAIRGAEPRLLADNLARPLLGFPDDQSLLDHFDAQPLSRFPGIDIVFALRSRYAEDELAAALHHGTTQYVILGAGLDTFAYRRPDLLERLDVFEVDHPGSQEWKRRRIAELELVDPPRLRQVAVDFEHDVLSNRLEAAGFDRHRPVFASLLGVSQYLTKAALSHTLRDIAALSDAGCTLVMEYIPPFSLLDEAERIPLQHATAGYAAIGEPWQTFLTDSEMAGLLNENGFKHVAPLDRPNLEARYLASRPAGTIMPRFVSYLRADTASHTTQHFHDRDNA